MTTLITSIISINLKIAYNIFYFLRETFLNLSINPIFIPVYSHILQLRKKY